MAQLYVNEPTAQISLSGGRFNVRYNDGMNRSLPIESIEGISLFGPVSITTQCVTECIKRGIPIQYYSLYGAYYGRLSSTTHVHTSRQRKQSLLYYNDDYRLQISKNIIRAKIHNQSVVLKRYARNSDAFVNNEIRSMLICREKISFTNSIEELMGFEGNAARNYFAALSHIIIPDFKFKGRSRRPPLDPFNSLLSLGYSILMNEVYGAIETHGLNPYFGFVHSDKEKHPTLASDLMEEWRPVIVDSVVLSMINGHEISKSEFYTDTENPGVFLTKKGFTSFVKKIEKRFSNDHKYLPYIDYSVSFRRGIYKQVGELVKSIDQKDASLYNACQIR